ncbi:Hypothetical predicted protein, partial [Pelobates cultripes]
AGEQGGTPSKMVDDTFIQTPEREISATHLRLEAFFNAFWRKLESRLAPTETIEAPPEPSHLSPKRPAANTMGPIYRCTVVKAACLQAPKLSTTKKETHRVGERRGEQLLTENLQRSTLAKNLRSQAIWDTNFPEMGI